MCKIEMFRNLYKSVIVTEVKCYIFAFHKISS